MAKEKVVAEKVTEEKPNFKFYRSRIAGLKVLIKDAVNFDPTTIEYVRFSPVKEKFEGDLIKVGYLKTDNKIAIEKLATDVNVSEITEEEYEKAVTKK